MNAMSTPPVWGPSLPTPRGENTPILRPPRAFAHHRPPRPFFVREIYKNGFLKRLPYGEKKSSPLSKLMRSDRFWAVFSVHDETFPFLELWLEPAEVATRPPMMVFPLIICQHISPSLVPADTEWSFVINFEQHAIRFACNSRSVMEEWVDCIRNKLTEMSILNSKGNLYSKVGGIPPVSTSSTPLTSRNPMSPLPEPPGAASAIADVPSVPNNTAGARTSIVDASDESNSTFTTSIYLNQTPPSTPATNPTGARPKINVANSRRSSIYLGENGRHVTVIPINNAVNSETEDQPSSPIRKTEQEKSKKQRKNLQESLSLNPSNREAAISRRSRTRTRSQRSSSLGPLLDDAELASSVAVMRVRTNSLESVDSNPRSALAKSDRRAQFQRRPLPRIPGASNEASPVSPTNTGVFGSPTNPFHLSSGGIPPHIPLPGLTCQMSFVPPQPMSSLPASINQASAHSMHSDGHSQNRSPKEQQVLRLRQEIGHPGGVRLTLRKRDCINSVALVDIFGCLFVAGWKQSTDIPILYKAFHIGDQIVSMGSGGVPVRTASEFHKIVKQKTAEMHIEIIIRRLPFGQTFYIKRDTENQTLGIISNSSTSEIKEIIPGSPASVNGMVGKCRSFDGQTFVPWTITEVNGRPLNLFAKEGEANDKLSTQNRDISIVIQPSDIVNKMKKQLKSVKGYKDYLFG